MTNKTIIAIVAVILAITLGIFAFTPKGSPVRYGGTTNLDSLGLTGSLTAAGTGYFGNGVLEGGYDLVNTASTTVNLALADLSVNSLVAIVASSSATTVNFPASSTLAAFLPNSGDMTRFIVQSASTTGSTIAFVGGTGTTLQTASTTKTIIGGDTASFLIYRKSTTDFNIVLTSIAR